MPYLGAKPTDVFADRDLNGAEFILDADADTSITADTDDQIDIRISGADDFAFKANKFEVQTGSNIDMNGTEFILDADGDTSITADTDDTIDVRIAGADDFQFTANTFTVSTGSRLFAPDGTDAAPSIALGASRNSGMYTTGDGNIALTCSGGTSGTGHTMIFLGNGTLYIDETTNGSMTTGLTLNQSAADNEILAFKSSDIAHGMTSVGETDTFASFQKNDNGVKGGLVILGMAESDYTGPGIELSGYSQATDTASSTSATAVTSVRASKTSGTGGAAVSSDANVFRIVASGNTQWICDAEGDTKYNGSDGAGAFDDWDDVELLTTARHVTVTDKKFAKQMFGNFVQENAEVLDKYGVITLNDDGHHFVSTKGLNALVIDAIRQTRNIQKAFYNILSDEQKNKFAGEIEEMKLPVLPAFQTP